MGAKGHLKWPDKVEALRVRRNQLAHEVDQFATWEEWRTTFFIVKRELEHLGVVVNLEPPPEVLYADENLDEECEDGDV